MSSSHRNSDKESDYGYSSCKSHDTLSASINEQASNTKPSSSSSSSSSSAAALKASNDSSSYSRKNSSNSKSHKVKKEERSLKCKSNDSYVNVKNSPSHSSASSTAAPSKLVKNKSTKILTTINKIKSSVAKSSCDADEKKSSVVHHQQ